MNILKPNIEEIQFPKKTNILTSLVWLSAITFPSGSVAAALAPWPMNLVVFVTGSLPVFSAIWYYRYWNREDPNRLQTEDFRIQLQALARISSSDGKDVIVDHRASLGENPMLRDGGEK
ncbi:MAG: hypothetical protein RIA72_16025 [Sphingopyxis sp.]|uniref:hypothetical protein n=1 Tax=Sphingopyxis sp. TaxID=1908224 RepID=UPI0032EF847C